MNEKPSLLIIGNANVGKSSITKLLLPYPKNFKGKIGKTPGSTLMIKPISQQNLPYNIVDLPGFGYTKHTSRRRSEHIKKQIVVHIEKNYSKYFFGLVVLNILRIVDELDKYFIQNKKTIPLSFELIQFLNEFKVPILVVLNKIDKISNLDKNKSIEFLITAAKENGINLVNISEHDKKDISKIPYLEFSALKKTNLKELKKAIQVYLN
ncbi:MAG: GTPase [Promethearchaeota archaeon]|jgi:GTP-binding protein EngB required for normal cell division